MYQSKASVMTPLKRLIDFRLVQFSTFIMPLFSLYWVLNMCVNFNIEQVILFVFLAYFLGFVTTIFMHRAWTHRAWTPHKYLNCIALFFYSLGCTTKSAIWCSVHRKHHRLSDTEQDPHSPYHKGKLHVMFNMYKMNWPKDLEYARDLMNDSLHLWFYQHYWTVNLTLWLILLCINVNYLFFWWAVLGFHNFKNKSFNVIGHNNSTTKKSTNSILFGWLYLHGEPWHQNHHEDPTNWRFGKHWYQIDLGAKLIQLFLLLGWGQDKKYRQKDIK